MDSNSKETHYLYTTAQLKLPLLTTKTLNLTMAYLFRSPLSLIHLNTTHKSNNHMLSPATTLI